MSKIELIKINFIAVITLFIYFELKRYLENQTVHWISELLLTRFKKNYRLEANKSIGQT